MYQVAFIRVYTWFEFAGLQQYKLSLYLNVGLPTVQINFVPWERLKKSSVYLMLIGNQ